MERLTDLESAIMLMREAQVRLDAAGFTTIAAHLGTALGFAEVEAARLRDGGMAAR